MKFINASFNTLQKILNEIYQCKTLIHYNLIINVISKIYQSNMKIKNQIKVDYMKISCCPVTKPSKIAHTLQHRFSLLWAIY